MVPFKMNSVPFSLLLLIFSLLVIDGLATTNLTAIQKCLVPRQLSKKLLSDAASIKRASTDFGNMVHYPPTAVLSPSSVADIQALIRSSNNCPNPFIITVKGNGHSTRGQAMAPNGVVIDMQELRNRRKRSSISYAYDMSYADVGGEVLWADLLNQTFARGVLPLAFTDYLGLSIGGTLSNAGIDGSTFHTGPQINNVLELDVAMADGTIVTCSRSKNPQLFFTVLGGLGQFGVITRARIPLKPARQFARRVRVFYTDFEVFKKDQESLVAINGSNKLDFVQGLVLLDNGTPNQWANNFLPPEEVPKIVDLQTKYGVVYSIDIVEPYNNSTKLATDKKIETILKGLNSIEGLVYTRDVSYFTFLNRVPNPDESLAYPWIDIFVPQSQVSDFNQGVYRNILLPRRNAFGPILIYPFYKNKWDTRMSAPIPDEPVFSVASILLNTNVSDWRPYEAQVREILKFCDDAGIKIKTYLYRHPSTEEWIKHFGRKWPMLKMMKKKYDPKRIFGGYTIF